MQASEKLDLLRQRMREHGIGALFVPHADEYQNEFIPPCAERLAWLTGFTGSAGYALIRGEDAYVLSDGRYAIQMKRQVDAACFITADSTVMTMPDFLASHCGESEIVGYDPKLMTEKQARDVEIALGARKAVFKALGINLVDQIWPGRPAPPMGEVQIFPDALAGTTSADKRKNIASLLKEKNVDAGLITLPDSIAWLLNIRGRDVAHNPVALSVAILHADGRVEWFIDEGKLVSDVAAVLDDDIVIRNPDLIGAALAGFAGKSVLADPQRAARYYFDILRANDIRIVEGDDPCIRLKAIKTPAEQAAMRQAHIRDGVAVTEFLCWLDDHADGRSEVDIALMLEEFRKRDPLYKDSSFDTICGWAANGAIVHYRAEAAGAARVEGNGLLLIDSGGQYLDGTTDITRTILVGDSTAEMRQNFTRVLKGHIALASARFKRGTIGAELDAIARAPLRAAGLDYAHGTGHGVGCYLSVHEESASISPRGTQAVLAGMILSNEPGYYKEGEYGIRIENLILCRPVPDEGDEMLEFETLTCAPYDMRLIDFSELSTDEKDWLTRYHAHVREKLLPYLSVEGARWLEGCTADQSSART